jgi:hypothetical protein
MAMLTLPTKLALSQQRNPEQPNEGYLAILLALNVARPDGARIVEPLPFSR